MKDISNYRSLKVARDKSRATIQGDDTLKVSMDEDVMIHGKVYYFHKWGMPTSGHRVYEFKLKDEGENV